jgi:Ni/Fe-hydrogenase subunit HybB-like protein
VAAGSALTLGLTVIYENLIRARRIDSRLRSSVAIFAGLTMLAYLYLKLWDYLATSYYSHLPARIEAQDLLNRTTPYGGAFWLVEVVLGALIPAIILLVPRLRRSDLVLIGVVVNRWNVTLSGLIIPLDWSPGVAEIFSVNAYQPALVEWAVAVGVVGYALLAFSLGLRYLPMFQHTE